MMLLYSGIVSMITLPVKFSLYLMKILMNDYETNVNNRRIKDRKKNRSKHE